MSASALRDGAGRLKQGWVLPCRPPSSVPGWKDPEGCLGKAGGLEEIGEVRQRGGGTHPALSSPLVSLPQAWGDLPSPSGTGEHVGGVEKLDALPSGLRPRSRPGRLEVGSTGHHGEQERRQLSMANR